LFGLKQKAPFVKTKEVIKMEDWKYETYDDDDDDDEGDSSGDNEEYSW